MNEEIKQADRPIIEAYPFFVIGPAKGSLLRERFVGTHHLYANRAVLKLLKS